MCLYTLAAGMLISQTDSAGTLYFLPDAQGSTRALTDEGGLLGQTFDYDAFGNLQDEYLNGLDTNYLYTGQQFDPISELYSLRARYYDPSLGRFLTRDTWPYDYQNPVELNRYVYTANNPATLSDPSGYGFGGYGLGAFGALLARQAAGVAVGGVVGFAAGAISAVAMWPLIDIGACGDNDLTFEQYVWASAKIGAAFGAFVGSLPPGAAILAMQWGSRIGMLLSFIDITRNGLNACNLIGFVAGYTGGSSNFTFNMPSLSIQFSMNAAASLSIVGVTPVSFAVPAAGAAGALFMSSGNDTEQSGENRNRGPGPGEPGERRYNRQIEPRERISGIYEFFDEITKKWYVGKSNDLFTRLRAYVNGTDGNHKAASWEAITWTDLGSESGLRTAEQMRIDQLLAQEIDLANEATAATRRTYPAYDIGGSRRPPTWPNWLQPPKQ